jgi:cytochrome c
MSGEAMENGRSSGATPGMILTRLILACWLQVIIVLSWSCGRNAYREAAAMTGGDPARGKAAIHNYGCDTCHTIPGIQGADALVGPPLNKMASRSYIGGVIPNTPANMIHWIQNPQDVDHQTAMPNLRVTETDARDIAGYLYMLK